MESSGKSRLGTQLFVLLYALLLLRTAWLCDDAYTTFRTVENVFQGYGPTYNPGERVQTFTHPLWMLVLCAGRCVSSDPYRVAMCLSLGLSLITVLLLVRAPSVTPVGAMLGVGILSLSRAFMDFSTSGLENPLTHLLLVLFLLSATNPIRSQGTQNRAGLWVLAGLSILNRMDIALLFLPWMAHTAWEGVRARRARGLLPALVGLSPFIAWEVFALVYYGFPFPNTAYAKLSSGLPWYALARQGVGYLANSVAVDPLTPLTIVAASIFALESGDRHSRVSVAGIVLYLGYLVSVGGDFMSGRFLAAPLLIGVWIWMRHPTVLQQPLLAAGVVGALGFLAQPNVFSSAEYLNGKGALESFDVSNERAFYYPSTGLFRKRDEFENHPWVKAGKDARAKHDTPQIVLAVGFDGFYAGPHVHVVDLYGLVDPLLARLPIPAGASWRTGHYERQMPAGYLETLSRGRNLIRDRKVAKLYRLLSLVVRGPIFSSRRFRALFEMNMRSFADFRS